MVCPKKKKKNIILAVIYNENKSGTLFFYIVVFDLQGKGRFQSLSLYPWVGFLASPTDSNTWACLTIRDLFGFS